MSVTTELRDMLDAHGIEVTLHRPVTKAELARENRELRELMQDMLMSPQDYCEKYGIKYKGWSSANDHIDARMRKLGVEMPK